MHANTKRRRETNKHGQRFLQSALPSNPFCSFDHAGGNESIVYFTDLCKPIKTYIYAKKKHPFASYPTAEHSNAANLLLQTNNKNQWTFLIAQHGRRL